MNDMLKINGNGGQNGGTRQPPAASAFGQGTAGQDISLKINANAIAKLLSSPEPAKKAEGLEKLGGNERALAYIADKTTDKDLREATLEKLTGTVDTLADEGALVCVAIAGNNAIARITATEMLHSQEALARAAMESAYGDSKSVAVSKLSQDVGELTSVDALICVAMEAESKDAKAKAIAGLAPYPGALLRVVLDSSYKDSRLLAFKLLAKDIEALKYIAKYCTFEDARKWAIQLASMHKSADHALVRIATDSEYEDARLKAVELLGNNEGALAFVVLNNDHLDSRVAAVERLVSIIKELQDVNALICVALYSEQPRPRFDAVGRLGGNPDALVRIALQSDDTQIRGASIKGLEGNGEALEYLAMNSQDMDVRLMATEGLLGHTERLMRIASDGQPDVKGHAVKVLARGVSNFELGLSKILLGSQPAPQD